MDKKTAITAFFEELGAEMARNESFRQRLIPILEGLRAAKRPAKRSRRRAPRRVDPTAKNIVGPELDGRAWLGTAEAYGTRFMLELFESRKHPGCYHFAVHCADDAFVRQSRRPVRAKEQNGVSIWTVLEPGLKREHGLGVSDFRWNAVEAESLRFSGNRVRAGE